MSCKSLRKGSQAHTVLLHRHTIQTVECDVGVGKQNSHYLWEEVGMSQDLVAMFYISSGRCLQECVHSVASHRSYIYDLYKEKFISEKCRNCINQFIIQEIFYKSNIA